MKTDKKIRFGLALLALAAPFLMMFSGGRVSALSPAMFKNVYSADRPLLAAAVPDTGGAGGAASKSTSTAATTTPTTVSTNSGNGCLNNTFGFSLAWLVCPVLDAASGLSNVLINIFETELQFTVGQLGDIKDPSSGIYKTRQTWSLVKNISSAILVIIMLVMVLSQAAGGGPFDAYTIRKLLPRLVAAVILMQISWDLFAWVVDLFNDLGRGLADIMAWPFGGPNQLSLFSLFANAKLDGVTGTAQLAILNWAAIGVGIALGIAYLFTMLGVALVALIGLGFAVLTLVFRKILIIMLLIFSPLALLAWILPGTERYWKMWFDNFLKALAMFPLAVAIIYAGRIFAYIVGSQDNSEFLNMIFIIAGFFGPLFILPKTFQWGGAAMSAVGGRIMSASSKVSEKPKGFLDKRQEQWTQQRRNDSATRIADYLRARELHKADPRNNPKPTFGKKAGLFMRGDFFRSGALDPTLGVVPEGVNVKVPKKVPLLGGKTVLKGGSKRRAAQEHELINKKEEISAEEAGKFGRALDAMVRPFGNDKDKIVDFMESYLLQHQDPEVYGTEQYVLMERMFRFKDTERGHKYLDAQVFDDASGQWVPNPDRLAAADSISPGLYDTAKPLDPSIVQDDYNVAEGVKATMTGAAWGRYARGEYRKSKGLHNAEDAQKAFDDFERIWNSPARGQLDPGAFAQVAARATPEQWQRLVRMDALGAQEALAKILSDTNSKMHIDFMAMHTPEQQARIRATIPQRERTIVEQGAAGDAERSSDDRTPTPERPATAPRATTGTGEGTGTGGGGTEEGARRAAGEQPQVNVNLNEEALGRSFARHMRNVLNETTLKIEHPTGEQGSGRFTTPPEQPGEHREGEHREDENDQPNDEHQP